jgi:hypothetical protein
MWLIFLRRNIKVNVAYLRFFHGYKNKYFGFFSKIFVNRIINAINFLPMRGISYTFH